MDAFLNGKSVRVDPTNIIFQIKGEKGWFRINENSPHDYPDIEPANVQRAKQASQRRRSKRNTSKKSKTSKKSRSIGSGKKPSR